MVTTHTMVAAQTVTPSAEVRQLVFFMINDEFALQHKPNPGEVPRLWSEIKSQTRSTDQVFEFLGHS